MTPEIICQQMCALIRIARDEGIDVDHISWSSRVPRDEFGHALSITTATAEDVSKWADFLGGATRGVSRASGYYTSCVTDVDLTALGTCRVLVMHVQPSVRRGAA